MSASKDYYQILGINKNASAEDIKQAYRKLAREHHPDMVRDGSKDAAEKRFKEINEAYQVLSDPQKKKMYDQYGTAGPGFGGFDPSQSSGFGRGGQWGPFTYTYSNSANDFGGVDPFDVFEDFFGFRGFGGQRSPRKGKNLYYEMEISLKDCIHGSEREVLVDSGKVTIKIPVGAKDGTELRFAGKGMPGPSGMPNGDLFITFRLPRVKDFVISGDNIHAGVKVSFVDAILGGETPVTVVDSKSSTGLGTTTMKIPSGTQSGTQFLLRGKGLPRLGGNGFGDAIVTVLVDIPKKVSKKQKELLENYRTS